MASDYIQGNPGYIGSSAYGAMNQALAPSGAASDTSTGLTRDESKNVSSALDALNASKNPSGVDSGRNDAAWMWRVYMGNDGLDHGGSSQPQIADYLDAPWASAYGMSKETAYNEAMTNTEYRRAVTDMQKAGLNPAVIFGAGKGSTAGVPGFISSASPGGGGGGSGGRRYGSGSSNSGNLFSNSAYSVLSALGGLVGVAATGNASGYWIGSSVTQGAMHAANGISKWFGK